MRGVEERLAWFGNHRPSAPGMCAEHVWLALGGPKDPPRQGLPDATAVFKAVPKGKMQGGRAPRGAIVYWTGGANGHGHVALALGDGREMSVDVLGPRTVGVKPWAWFGTNWPALTYKGWSWYWGQYDTEPKPEPKPTPEPVKAAAVSDLKGKTTTGSAVTWWRDYSGKPDTTQVMPGDGKWRKVDGIPLAAPPVSGREDHMLYVRLGLLWRPDSTRMGIVEARWVRDSGTPDDPKDDDATAYTEVHYEHGTKSVPLNVLHFEEGEAGVGGAWWMRFSGGLTGVEITTRYAKTYVLSVS